uniref:Uncharacterized protein n=1 Tax=Rhizophora mucronata TaxID=61149 RepID=A0A2P2PHC8_RHIMU
MPLSYRNAFAFMLTSKISLNVYVFLVYYDVMLNYLC